LIQPPTATGPIADRRKPAPRRLPRLATAVSAPRLEEVGAADGAAAAACAARYQSYRAEDNSYQPYDGPRRACVPPARQVVASAAY
jgi:hypothetical protein